MSYSTIKRYEPSSHRSADFGMAENPSGRWVSHDDWLSLLTDFSQMTAWGRGLEHNKRLLEEENAILKAQSNFYRSKLMNETEYSTNIELLDRIKHLEAIVERLTRASEPWLNAIRGKDAKEASKDSSLIEDLGNGVEKHDMKFRITPTVNKNKPNDGYNGNIKGLDF